jgi:hypothetical protein
MMPTVWTISYQGRSVEDLVEVLRRNGIERVVHIGSVVQDIEGTGFEEDLRNGLEKAGIEYRHLQGVEEPPEFRGIAADRGREELTAAFNAYLSKRGGEMEDLLKIIKERPTAILCFLQGEQACQGAVLMQMLEKRGQPIKRL